MLTYHFDAQRHGALWERMESGPAAHALSSESVAPLHPKLQLDDVDASGSLLAVGEATVVTAASGLLTDPDDYRAGSVGDGESMKRRRTDCGENDSTVVFSDVVTEAVKVWIKAGTPEVTKLNHPGNSRVTLGSAIVLQRALDRPGYPNAIRVFIDIGGGRMSVGFVDNESADQLAGKLDRGWTIDSAVAQHRHASTYVGIRAYVSISSPGA